MSHTTINSGAIARDWWRALQPDPPEAGDRAALAKLRRCATVAEAMTEPATLKLFQHLKFGQARDLPAVALTAAVLAHVRKDSWAEKRITTARLVGPQSLETPETALLKPVRFRRLIEATGGDERLAAFRRLVSLANNAVPVADLADALLRWTNSRRRDWVLQYWNAMPAPAAPNQPASKDATP